MFLPVPVIYGLVFICYVASVYIHYLVQKKRIPFTSINGGRSKTFEEQVKVSKQSIFILGVLCIYVIATLIFPEFRKSLVFLIATSLLILFWLFGTVLQILGTKFEKRVVVWINLLGVISHILLMLNYFSVT